MALMESVRECGCTDCDCCQCGEQLVVAKGRLRLAQRHLAQSRRNGNPGSVEYWIRQVKYLRDEINRLYRAEKK
jgi:hypothetical protein